MVKMRISFVPALYIKRTRLLRLNKRGSEAKAHNVRIICTYTCARTCSWLERGGVQVQITHTVSKRQQSLNTGWKIHLILENIFSKYCVRIRAFVGSLLNPNLLGKALS